MNDEKRQYLLSILSWINILVFTPVLFLTIIFNAQTYVYQVHTDQAMRMLTLYVLQLLILLALFVPAVVLQLKETKLPKEQVLFLLVCESAIMLTSLGLDAVVTHYSWHLYGGILLLFLQSYVASLLFCVNIVGSMWLLKKEWGQYCVKKRTYIYIGIFVLLIVSLYVLR